MFERISHSGPRLKGRGLQETAFADGLLGVGYAAPDPDTALGGAAQIPQSGVGDGRMSKKDCHV